jgi:cytochrome c
MIGRIPAAILSFIASVVVGTGAAFAGCAEDLTRIQIAAPAASPDVRAAVNGLVATAQARARARDASGCAGATTEALRLLDLPTLAPVTLSTPVPGVDRRPQPPHLAAAGSQATTDGLASATKPMGSAPSVAPSKPSPQVGRRQASRTKSDQPQKADLASKDLAPKDLAQKKDWYVVTSNVIGSDVMVQDRPGENVGKIDALVIDSTTGQASLVLIETGGVLGFGGKLIAVPFSAIQFFGRWDRPMIRTDVATLHSGPRVTTTDVPDLVSNAKWRADLARHFKVAPLARPKTPAPSSAVAVATRPQAAPPATPGSASSGDPAEGRTYVLGICAACHTFDQGGGTRVGPNLYSVVDRKIAGEPDFNYSAALKGHGGNWSAANLDGYLRNPQTFAPGTTMPFSGISSSSERRNVIAYLESLANAQGAQK